MSRMNQKQRDYFVDKIKKITDESINAHRAKYASTISKMANDKYQEFLKELDIKDDMEAMRQAEEVLEMTHVKLEAVEETLQDLEEKKNRNPYGYRGRPNKPDYVEYYTKAFQKYCTKVAEKHFYKTPEGIELATLEKVREDAIDLVMLDGCKVEELSGKLNGILSKGNMKLIGQ